MNGALRALRILRSRTNRAKLIRMQREQGGGSSALSFADGLEMIYNPGGTGTDGGFYLFVPIFGITYESELLAIT